MRKYVITIIIVAVFVAPSLLVRYSQKAKRTPSSFSQQTMVSSKSSATSTSSSHTSAPIDYQDGSYTGSVENAFYGNVQVSVVISGGKIVSVNFVQYPDDNQTSIGINQQAIPALQHEAIASQSSHVDIVSGATFTSQAFAQSLATALARA
jgi:uncharacterized protein with FMN-binding domain